MNPSVQYALKEERGLKNGVDGTQSISKEPGKRVPLEIIIEVTTSEGFFS